MPQPSNQVPCNTQHESQVGVERCALLSKHRAGVLVLILRASTAVAKHVLAYGFVGKRVHVWGGG